MEAVKEADLSAKVRS